MHPPTSIQESRFNALHPVLDERAHDPSVREVSRQLVNVYQQEIQRHDD